MTGSATIRPPRRQHVAGDTDERDVTQQQQQQQRNTSQRMNAQSSDEDKDRRTSSMLSSSESAPYSSMQVSHYQLGDCLGKGAFGIVHRGLNLMTGETVAVKQIRLGNIPKAELGEIMAEIDLLKNLKHPNIVKYKGSEKTREHLFIILEYCENGSLQHICKRFGKFPEGLVGVYTFQVLEGLTYLHDQGVIHRDIKGANILTNKDGSVKLADFGVATKAGSLLQSNAVVGSPYWMAPEVIDQSGATTASDIWSVGCVVIELLQGKPPYHFLDPMPALFRIVQDDSPPLPEGASAPVKDFLIQCFQKDANLRVSARKLSRHPWIMSARKQLQKLRAGGSLRGMPAHAEAVKSVQEWNEALREPIETAAQPHKSHFKGATVRRSHLTSKNPSFVSQALNNRQASSSAAQKKAECVAVRSAAEYDGLPVLSSPDKKSRPALISVLQEREQRSLLLASHDRSDHQERSNEPQKYLNGSDWRSDNGDAELEDAFATIKPSMQPKNSSKRQMLPTQKTIDDYSDLVVDEDVPALNAKIAHIRERTPSANQMLRPALHPVSTGENVPKFADPHYAQQCVARASDTLLDNFAERDEEDDFSDLVSVHENEHLQLRPRLTSECADDDPEQTEDPFGELDDTAVPIADDVISNIARDRHARMCAHVVDLFQRLALSTPEDKLIETCDELEMIMTNQREMKAQALAAHGALIVLQLLEAINIRDVINRLLGLLNIVIYDDTQAQENLCLIGAIPVVMPFCCKKYPHEVRIEAAHFIFSMCSSSALTLQFVLSCRGLKTLVELIDEDYSERKDLVWLGVACVNSVLELQSRASRNDFCRMLASDGLLEPLSTALLCALDDTDEDNEYAVSARDHILQILLIYASSEPLLKEQLASRRVMRKLLQACNKLDPSSLTILLKSFKNLTMNPTILDELENCNIIEVLVNILSKQHNGPWGNEMSNQILNAMYNLCRLNARRQEEAAQAGLIPQLLRVAEAQSPLRQFALPILCDMAHSGKATRKLLNQQCGIEFFLRLLQDPNWQLQSMETIQIWLQEDFARVETILLRPSSVQSLLHVFAANTFVHLENYLESFVKIVKLSSSIALALGDQDQFIARLKQHLQRSQKAILRLSLLRILKVICDVHAEIARLERQHDLITVLEAIAGNDKAVLVQELAREIVQQLREPRSKPSLAAKDAQRTVRRAASETSGNPSPLISAQTWRLQSIEKNPAGRRANASLDYRLPFRQGNLLRSDQQHASRDGKTSRETLEPIPSNDPSHSHARNESRATLKSIEKER